ncbi:MAG: hypothetical protein AAF806_13600 [Bacteroidota bacterium]
MFKSIVIPFVLLAAFFLVTACDDDSACADNFNFATEVADELNALNDAAVAFGQDQSPENCNAYKTAATDYIDALEDLKSCAEIAGQGVAYQQALDSTQAEIDALMCN